MAVVGLTVSPPSAVSVKVTGRPLTGWLCTSVTLKVRIDSSGRPEARTPMAVGAALTNCADAAGRVGVAVAVAVPVAGGGPGELGVAVPVAGSGWGTVGRGVVGCAVD